jgi:hypothetical protein
MKTPHIPHIDTRRQMHAILWMMLPLRAWPYPHARRHRPCGDRIQIIMLSMIIFVIV